MKIIKKGKIPNLSKELTCKKCASILEYIPEDVQKEEVKEYDQREGWYSENVYFIVCPVCNHRNTV